MALQGVVRGGGAGEGVTIVGADVLSTSPGVSSGNCVGTPVSPDAEEIAHLKGQSGNTFVTPPILGFLHRPLYAYAFTAFKTMFLSGSNRNMYNDYRIVMRTLTAN